MPAEISGRHTIHAPASDSTSRERNEFPRAALWLLAGLLLFLLGNGAYSLFDRDEPRFAEASRFMAEKGDWVVPMFNGNLRPDKPVFIYWLQGSAMRVLGPNEFAARFFSALAGAFSLALVFCFARRLGASRGGAHAACAVLLLSPLFVGVSKAAITDSLITFTVVSALFLYWENMQVFRWWRHLLFWAIIAMSALTKGPPGLLVVGCTVATWHAWNRLRPPVSSPVLAKRPAWLWRALSGLAFFLALGLPWAILVWQRTDGVFFRIAIGHHVIDRATQPLEGHSGPFFYYLPVLLVAFLPVWGALIPALRGAWRERQSFQLRFLWSWIILALVVFSSVKTKLPHYITPLLPAVALMIGLEWTQLKKLMPGRWTCAGIGALQLLFGLAAAAALIALPLHYALPGLLAPAVVFGVLFVAALGASAWMRPAARSQKTLAVAALLLFCAYAVAFAWLLPAMEPLRPSKRLTSWLHGHAPAGTRLVAVDYQEPSLVFYWRNQVTMLGKNEGKKAFELLGEKNKPTALVVPPEKWNKWLSLASAEQRAAFHECHKLRFFSPKGGKWQELLIIANWDGAAQQAQASKQPDRTDI